MRKRGITTMVRSEGRLIVGVVMVLWAFGGCAAETPKMPPPITPDQVRDHSEKAFDKLKQEEKSRGSGSTSASQ